MHAVAQNEKLSIFSIKSYSKSIIENHRGEKIDGLILDEVVWIKSSNDLKENMSKLFFVADDPIVALMKSTYWQDREFQIENSSPIYFPYYEWCWIVYVGDENKVQKYERLKFGHVEMKIKGLSSSAKQQ